MSASAGGSRRDSSRGSGIDGPIWSAVRGVWPRCFVRYANMSTPDEPEFVGEGLSAHWQTATDQLVSQQSNVYDAQ